MDELEELADQIQNALEIYESGVALDAEHLPVLLRALAEGVRAALRAKGRV